MGIEVRPKVTLFVDHSPESQAAPSIGFLLSFDARIQ